MKGFQKGLLGAVLLIGGLALFGGIASAATTKTIHVGDTNNNSLTDVQAECDATGGQVTSWHFVINGIKKTSDKPESILVTWQDGSQAVVPLDSTASKAKVGHYTTGSPTGSAIVTDAEAEIFSDWSGQFVLSHVTCEIVESVAANVFLTKSVAGNADGPFIGTVCFMLTPGAGSSAAEQCHDYSTGEQHVFTWNDLPVGDYTVSESLVPAGYFGVFDLLFTVQVACDGSEPLQCFEASAAAPTYDLGTFENTLLD